MQDDERGMAGRRTVLKGIGTIGAAGLASGLGMNAMTGDAAASTVNIGSSNPGKISNDRGDLTELTVDPSFTVQWDGLDDAVGKIFWLLEAKVGNGEFQPIYRATPWLGLDSIGTSGSFTRAPSWNGGLGPLVIADENGRPAYDSFNWDNLEGVTEDSYLNGVSMQSSDNYVPGDPNTDESDGPVVPSGHFSLQNNFPAQDAGYYGAASDTTSLDNTNDDSGSGSSKSTTVTLRYTIELQRPNLGQLEYEVTDSGSYQMPDGYSDMSTQEKKQALAELIDGVQVSDIDAGNSRLVMEGEDGYQSFNNYDDGAGIPYDVLQSYSSHVGIMVENASMSVKVVNEGSGAGATGSSNPGAS